MCLFFFILMQILRKCVKKYVFLLLQKNADFSIFVRGKMRAIDLAKIDVVDMVLI